MKLGGEEIEFTDNSGSVTIASSVMTDLANGEYELIIATDVGSCFATVREMLEALTGKDVRCMAYPCGGVNNVLIVNACNFAFSML